jgi:glycosyltransferase involved in cell wall biosynthesis
LTIALLTKNSEDTVRFALRSVYRQKIPDNVTFELIVVDGYSKDNTLKIAAEEIQKLKERFLSQFTRHIILQEGVGVGYARNLALKEAQGDWILWIDSDNVLAQDYVLKAVKEIEKINHENIAVLYPQRAISVLKKRNFASRLIACYGKVLARQSNSKLFAIAKKLLSERLEDPIQRMLPYTATQGAFCNIEALRKVGGFNPYLVAAEDIDVFLKLISNGYKMRPFNSTLYYFTRDSLRAWFRQAVTWEYGRIVMYLFSTYGNKCSTSRMIQTQYTLNTSKIIEFFVTSIINSVTILMTKVQACTSLEAFFSPLLYFYRRVGYSVGHLHGLRQERFLRKLLRRGVNN